MRLQQDNITVVSSLAAGKTELTTHFIIIKGYTNFNIISRTRSPNTLQVKDFNVVIERQELQ